ncbi:MAG: hypothetical protein PSV35_06200 [bacterium]|nr:hypothetical protein [bacterium]
MKFMLKSLSTLTLSLGVTVAFAATVPPVYLITHNNTSVQSNAFVNGNIPSPYPSQPNSTRSVFWNIVKLACYGHVVEGKCSALIKMATDTAKPITVGTVALHLETGDITPKTIIANGYKVVVNGPGEVTLSEVK